MNLRDHSTLYVVKNPDIIRNSIIYIFIMS